MATLGERLKAHWLAQALLIRPGVSQQEVAAFESRYAVHFPADVRGYLGTVDGMGMYVEDNALFGFFPLSAIKPVPEELAGMDGTPDYSPIMKTLGDPASWFVFVEYLIWSHVYALRLSPDPSEKTPVIWISGELHGVISPSFTEFAESYLTDPESLLVP